MLNELGIVSFDSKRNNRFCQHITSMSQTTAFCSDITASQLYDVDHQKLQQPPLICCGVARLFVAGVNARCNYLLSAGGRS